MIKIEWMNKEMREISFTFLFNKFKTKYLLWLLPDFHARDIYEPVLGRFRLAAAVVFGAESGCCSSLCSGLFYVDMLFLSCILGEHRTCRIEINVAKNRRFFLKYFFYLVVWLIFCLVRLVEI